LSNISRRKTAGEKNNDKSVVCVVCCIKQLSTTTILPMANMRLTHEGIGIYVVDWSFAVAIFMNVELGILFFDKKNNNFESYI
jgi:hypothetical protein